MLHAAAADVDHKTVWPYLISGVEGRVVGG